jgi:hypothetical protein
VGDDTLLVSADAYNKAEVDNIVLQNINDLDDALMDVLDLKADKSTTYTKTEVDTALGLKQKTMTTGTGLVCHENLWKATRLKVWSLAKT